MDEEKCNSQEENDKIIVNDDYCPVYNFDCENSIE